MIKIKKPVKKPLMLKQLKDNVKFAFQNTGTIYTVQKKQKGKVEYTSDWSGRTFTSKGTREIFSRVSKEGNYIDV